MKRKTRILTVLVAVFMLLVSIMACSPSEPPVESTPSPSSSTQTGGKAIALEDIKIGVVLNTSKEDGGWSQAHYESFLRTKQELGLRDDQLVVLEEIPDTGTATENAIELMINDGCNVIFGTSSGQTDPIAATSKRYPDLYFHQFEGKTLDNCSPYTIRDYEAIFMCGYAAAKMSTVNELGFQAAQPQASVVRAINAWAAGAKYANPDATVRVVWTNSWYDPAAEKEGANSMLDSGIQCLGYHGSTTAVMQAAAEHNGYGTGFHIDMKSFAPTAVLTSFIWNWTPIYNEYLQNIANGTWTNATMFKGMESGCAAITPFNADIMSADIIADCEAVAQKVIDGDITVFRGPLSDNKGNQLLADGEEFTDAEWIGMMYLADNVIGDLP